MYGCTDPAALNYNPLATIDDGNCRYDGCMDPTASNYNPIAVIDDGSCVYTVLPTLNTGNTISTGTTTTTTIGTPTLGGVFTTGQGTATTTTTIGTPNLGGVLTTGQGTTTTTSGNTTTILPNLGSGIVASEPVLGCTDALADNYNPLANTDDGSCTYTVNAGCECSCNGLTELNLIDSLPFVGLVNATGMPDPVGAQSAQFLHYTISSNGLSGQPITNFSFDSGFEHGGFGAVNNGWSGYCETNTTSSLDLTTNSLTTTNVLMKYDKIYVRRSRQVNAYQVAGWHTMPGMTSEVFDSWDNALAAIIAAGIYGAQPGDSVLDVLTNGVWNPTNYVDQVLGYSTQPGYIGTNAVGCGCDQSSSPPPPPVSPGFNDTPDDSSMLDDEIIVRGKIIKSFNLDLSDLPATSEHRRFSISGDKGAEFKLEIKDNTTGYYYNFVTNAFQADASSLEEKISSNSYSGSITFPAVTGGDDQYDIFLHAKPGTEHVAYREKRFGDGSLDINGSTGSNSLMMQKVIYQYAALDLTLQGFSPNSTVAGTMATDTISINRGKRGTKTAFSMTCTAATTAAYRILKQPEESDVLAYVEPVVGSAPIDLPGENIYPTVTETAQVQTGGISSSATIILRAPVPDIAVGDKWHSDGAMPIATQIVQSITTDGDGNVTQFVTNTAASHSGSANLTFYARKNYSWPINNYVDRIKEDMIVIPSTNITTSSIVSKYEDSITIFEGTEKEEIIIKNQRSALDTLNKKPTVVKGLVTVQEGQVVFDKQQVLALAGDTIGIGGYGENEILRVYGWEVKFTDLAIALTTPTTTTTEVSAGGSSADIAVTSKEGVINNVSRVGGIGINPALQNPLITAGGGATGGGDWTMDAVQTLENGITLTVENTSRVATITGNIEIIKAGTASQTLKFDVEKLLSTSA